MKSQFLLTPFLSTMMVVSAFAQQPSSNATPPPAASTEQSATSSPRASQDFWDGEEPSLGSLLFHPFASKEYVRRHTEPLRDRVNELDELTETHRKNIKDVDARAQQGIQVASAKVSLADQHAQEASMKAQTAQQTATGLDTRLNADEKIVGGLDEYKAGAQTEIRFRAGQTVLSKQSKDALDEMAAQLKDKHGYIIEVQGFAAGHSQASIANSRKMADSVVRYLVLNHEIPAYRIYVIATGDNGDNKAGGARVEVNLLKNEIEQVAKQ